jgi:hypothetical protein
MRAIVANTSWDKTAARMHELIQTTEPGNKAKRLNATNVEVTADDEVEVLPIAALKAARAADLPAQAAG